MADRPKAPSDAALRKDALAVLTGNRHGNYTVPALGLYPYQWCWDTGPIVLGWASVGEWDQAWGELDKLFSAQWPSGMMPHIVFWEVSDDYFPGPDVWATDRNPPTTGLTQPPLPVSAAARLFEADPDRARAREQLGLLWPRLVAWLAWIERARTGPHLAAVVVHPWESGMDNSPAWDDPLAATPQATHEHLERRDTATVSAKQRPSTREYRHYLGIVAALRKAGWDTERQVQDSPFAVEDPAFTAITARAAADLADVAAAAGQDDADVKRIATQARAGLAGLWDEELGWYRAFDVRAGTPTGPPTASGLVALFGGVDGSHAAAYGRSSRPVVECGEVLRRFVGPDRRRVRSDPLLARAGLGARQLAGGRRDQACRASTTRPRHCAWRRAPSSTRASPSTTTRVTAPASAVRGSRGARPSPSTG